FGLELDIPEQKQEEQQDDIGLDLEIEDTTEENIDSQLQEIRHHIDRNEVVTASKLLAGLSSSSPEAQHLKKTVSTALANRDKLLSKIEELENEDRFADAYKIFKKVQAIAVDTPALSDIGQRLQQSQAMLDAFSQPKQKTDEQESFAPDLPTDNKGAKKKKNTEKSPPKGKQQATPPKAPKPSRPPIEIPVKSILTGLALLALGGGATFLYTSEMDKIIELERKWIEIKYQRCQTPEQFQQKRIHSEQLLVRLKSVYLPWLGQNKLVEDITTVLNSDNFKKGESGDREYKGVPLPAPLIEKLIPIDDKFDKAATAAQKEEFTTALSLYQDVITLAEKAKPSPLDPQFEIMSKELDKRTQEVNTKLTEIQGQAQQEEERKKKQQIEDKYIQAIDFFEKTKKKDNDLSELEPDSPDSDGTSLPETLWDECIKRLQEYERLLQEYEQLLKEHPEINSKEKLKTIRTYLAYSRLYQYLGVAREAYKKRDLAKAIEEYQSALDLLDEERVLFDKFYKENEKIKRTILMLTITLELRKAVEAENKNDLRNSLTHYSKVIK
ncbi:MAG: tetratricopeptide repeat protein, partial [Candidatus Electrothrix sp. AUS4]|nr:tetratricopeptide repeat protein [Candidatus Electrothrix sp. AUS4]